MIVFLLMIGIGCLLVFLFVYLQSKKLGSLTKDILYSDTDRLPGQILFAQSLNLKGKPDYLIKDATGILPVEVKTGKTPTTPYLSHTMQLVAYCLLVEENYGTRPRGGILKYPEKEFKIQYTTEAELSLRDLVKEITTHKTQNDELFCENPHHLEYHPKPEK